MPLKKLSKGVSKVKEIQLFINDTAVSVSADSTVLEAARLAGVEIPTLCHHAQVSGVGACRMCIVEVEGARNLPASCVQPVTEGMKVYTESEKVIRARQDILRLMIANHPMDCLTCESGGACKLQNYCYHYGVAETPYGGEVSHRQVIDCNPFIQRDYSKCILCGLCVRACAEVQGNFAIDFSKRGFTSEIAAPFGEELEGGGCTFCGQCLDMCPTGALQAKIGKGLGRAWEKQKVKTTCSYCGVGCSMYLEVKDGKVVGIAPDFTGSVNQGHLCVKGRFGWDYIHSDKRLTTPLIRKDGHLHPASWDEALTLVADKLIKARADCGPDSIGFLSSARCTNEENYLFQKLARAVVGTNNIDHCARL